MTFAPSIQEAVPPASTSLGMILPAGGTLGVLVFVFQVVCAVHLFRHRRDWWWLWLIFFFPPIGPLVYFFVEMYPEMRGPARPGRETGRLSGSAARRIRLLEQELERMETVDKRSQLATAYLDAARFEEARKNYEQCLRGMYKDDPHMRYGLAQACFAEGDFAAAVENLQITLRQDLPDYLTERRYLLAQALEELGRNEEALAAYEQCVARLPGVGGRCRYALLLERCGRAGAAAEQFRLVAREARTLSGSQRRRDRDWIELARERNGQR